MNRFEGVEVAAGNAGEAAARQAEIDRQINEFLTQGGEVEICADFKPVPRPQRVQCKLKTSSLTHQSWILKQALRRVLNKVDKGLLAELEGRHLEGKVDIVSDTELSVLMNMQKSKFKIAPSQYFSPHFVRHVHPVERNAETLMYRVADVLQFINQIKKELGEP